MSEVLRKCPLVSGSLNPYTYLFRYKVIIVPLDKRKISLKVFTTSYSLNIDCILCLFDFLK